MARLLRGTRFPDLKTMDQLDWDALRGIERPQLAQLTTCDYLERGEDVVIAGPIGTGKTHLAIALGVEAVQRRQRVALIRAAALIRELVEPRDERTLSRLHQRYLRVALLIVDELGSCPSTGPAANCSSTCSPIAARGAPRSSPPTSRSPSGSRSSATRS